MYDRNVSITSLRPFLLLLVIFNHCTPVVFSSSILDGGLLPIIFGNILTPAATGLFFLISGYLYFNRVNEFTYNTFKVKSQKRIITYVLPYLIWNCISASYEFAFQILKKYTYNIPIDFNILEQLWCCHVFDKESLNILGVPMPMYGPSDLPLWFLRDLIVVSFLTPIIYYLLKRLKTFCIFILAGIYVTQLWTSIPGFGIHAIFYFCLGSYMAINKNGFYLIKSNSLNLLIVVLSIVSTINCVYVYPQSFENLRYLLQITTILLTISIIWLAIKFNARYNVKIPQIIEQSSFFVYAVHACGLIFAPITLCRKLFDLIHIHNELFLCFLYLLLPFIVYGISVLYFYILNKYFKPVMFLLTGNR